MRIDEAHKLANKPELLERLWHLVEFLEGKLNSYPSEEEMGEFEKKHFSLRLQLSEAQDHASQYSFDDTPFDKLKLLSDLSVSMFTAKREAKVFNFFESDSQVIDLIIASFAQALNEAGRQADAQRVYFLRSASLLERKYEDRLLDLHPAKDGFDKWRETLLNWTFKTRATLLEPAKALSLLPNDVEEEVMTLEAPESLQPSHRKNQADKLFDYLRNNVGRRINYPELREFFGAQFNCSQVLKKAQKKYPGRIKSERVKNPKGRGNIVEILFVPRQ